MNSSRSSVSALGIVGLVVGTLGVAGPIAWDFYKTRTELEVRATDFAVVIGENAKIDGLTVLYKGEELDRLSKAILVITNTGRTPILQKDVVQPITIAFSPESRVVDVRIDSLSPRDLQATLSFDLGQGSLSIATPLLNPGDRIALGVLLKAERIDYSATARIAGVTSLTVSKDVLAAPSIPPRRHSWTIYPVGFFSILLALAAIVGFTHWPAEKRAKKAARTGGLEIPQAKTRAELLAWVDRAFFFATSGERKQLKAAIDTLPNSDDFVAAHYAQIQGMLKGCLDSMTPNFPMATIVLSIAVGGLWYVAYQLLAP